MHEWEDCTPRSDHDSVVGVTRFAVPGGWIYEIGEGRGATVFVPTPVDRPLLAALVVEIQELVEVFKGKQR